MPTFEQCVPSEQLLSLILHKFLNAAPSFGPDSDQGFGTRLAVTILALD